VPVAEHRRLEQVDGFVVVLREVGEPAVLDDREDGERDEADERPGKVPAQSPQDDAKVMIVSVP
jgi:hypothetical protein